jgi:hypothetical protein
MVPYNIYTYFALMVPYNIYTYFALMVPYNIYTYFALMFLHNIYTYFALMVAYNIYTYFALMVAYNMYTYFALMLPLCAFIWTPQDPSLGQDPMALSQLQRSAEELEDMALPSPSGRKPSGDYRLGYG